MRGEEPNRSSDGTDGSHALAADFEARSGGQSGRSGGHGSRNGGGRGKRDSKGRPPYQRQPQQQQCQPRHQREQPAHQPQKQHGIRLTGEQVSRSACSRAKGYRAPTPHHATRRATQPMGLVHVDTAGPYPTSLGGSRHVVMFVDSASCLQRSYGARKKSVAAIFSVVKRFAVDMGVPRAFRTDSGTE